jgi:hypothetical protein
MCYRGVSASRRVCPSIALPKGAPRVSAQARRRQVIGRRLRSRAIVIAACYLALAVSAGCGDRVPAAPSDMYQGFWTGTINDTAGGAGTLRISLTGGSPLNGTWAATLPVVNLIGTVTSEATTRAQRSLALACGASGSIGLNAIVDGTTMTGNYLAVGCGLSTGAISLVRR